MSEEDEEALKESFWKRLLNFTIDDARALLAFVIVIGFIVIYYNAMPDPVLMSQVIRDWSFIVGVVIAFYFAGKYADKVAEQLAVPVQAVEPVVVPGPTVEEVVDKVVPVVINAVAEAIKQEFAKAQAVSVAASR